MCISFPHLAKIAHTQVSLLKRRSTSSKKSSSSSSSRLWRSNKQKNKKVAAARHGASDPLLRFLLLLFHFCQWKAGNNRECFCFSLIRTMSGWKEETLSNHSDSRKVEMGGDQKNSIQKFKIWRTGVQSDVHDLPKGPD